ncbi:M48 family metalloprotease [Candidatus Saccharibacteria bacterium]|nr:M48 family metalloprotease [Candidatus Saccharibacteria bacterium]NIV04584.1 M48 family metalloprotease [Calditrichia bacterium]NIS39129.1 M48 family metalloprotease [Candidatus Saccharibacteria bacterium]NIV73198.1 M48 family metalloprotease [Calditrichia bacterium]NIW00558.1 M48 family metalloprotease [Candidatus Saccharibacteria bacterium]
MITQQNHWRKSGAIEHPTVTMGELILYLLGSVFFLLIAACSTSEYARQINYLNKITARLNKTAHIRIVNSDILHAGAWRSGDIWITSALLTQANEQQIAAVLAHEIAHIENNNATEYEADEIAVSYLISAGYDAQSMANVLKLFPNTHQRNGLKR